METDYAAKIGKLLAKAEGTDNAHEAEVFMAKAEALMIQQGISEAIARQAGGVKVHPESIVEHKVELYTPRPTQIFYAPPRETYACAGACGRDLPVKKFPTTKRPRWREVECRACRDARYASGAVRPRDSAAYNRIHVEGFFHIARALGLRGYRRGDSTFYAVGFERDADRAATLLLSLHTQSVAAMWRWWKDEGSARFMTGWADMDAADRLRARREFTMSFYYGAASRIRSERVVQVDATPGAALAVRSKETEVNDHVDAMGLRESEALDLALSAAGLEAGRKADVGTTSTPGRRTAIS